MPREIIRPKYGIPCIVKLGNKPTLVEGKSGQQWRYFVNDDEAILYLDGPAHEAIQDTEAGNGQEICLRKTKVGRSTHWEAERVENEPVPVEVIAGEPPELMSQHEASHWERIQQARGKVNGSANGNGNGHHAAPPPANPPPAGQPPEPHAPGTRMYAMALRSAIDAVKFAQDYAAGKGLELKFTTEDVRCMAATLYIDQRKESR